MIICVKYLAYPQKYTQIFLELISKYSRVAGYKVNIQKPIIFLYTSSEQLQSKIKIPFTESSKSKHKSSKTCIELIYEKLHNTSEKKQRRSSVFVDWKTQYF